MVCLQQVAGINQTARHDAGQTANRNQIKGNQNWLPQFSDLRGELEGF
jgi:hypothetical protein